MTDVSSLRLYLIRGMYLVMVVGLTLIIWPTIIAPGNVVTGSTTAVRAMLAGLSLLALLGLRYPLQMLPVLIFELLWKMIWILAFALPAWLGPGLDGYTTATLIECAVGIVLVPLALPWSYILQHYVLAKGTPWSQAGAHTRLPCAGRSRHHTQQG